MVGGKPAQALQGLASAKTADAGAHSQGGPMRYSAGAAALHWLIAALILLNVAVAFYAAGLPRAGRSPVLQIHGAIGLTVLLLTGARVAWRLAHPAPPFGPWLKAWERRAAKAVHGVFYLLMVAVPLMGWSMASARGRSVSLFGLFTVRPLPLPASAAPTFDSLHVALAYLMIGLVTLHVAAALKHQFLGRDHELARMWVGRGQPQSLAGEDRAHG